VTPAGALGRPTPGGFADLPGATMVAIRRGCDSSTAESQGTRVTATTRRLDNEGPSTVSLGSLIWMEREHNGELVGVAWYAHASGEQAIELFYANGTSERVDGTSERAEGLAEVAGLAPVTTVDSSMRWVKDPDAWNAEMIEGE
jgi:hypothetical protein